MPKVTSDPSPKTIAILLVSGLALMMIAIGVMAGVYFASREAEEKAPPIAAVSGPPKEAEKPVDPPKPEFKIDAPVVSPPRVQPKVLNAESEVGKLGELDVKIKDVRFSVVVALGSGGRINASPEQWLNVFLEITNTSKTVRVPYSGWWKPSADGKRTAVMHDNFSNQCRTITFPPIGKMLGRYDAPDIDPGEVAKDLLVFQKPIEAATDLYLRLPGEAVGVTGESLTFRIPRSMIRIPRSKKEKAN